MISSVITSVYQKKDGRWYGVFVVGSHVRHYHLKDDILDVCRKRIGLPTFPLLDWFNDKDGKVVVYCIGVGIPIVS